MWKLAAKGNEKFLLAQALFTHVSSLGCFNFDNAPGNTLWPLSRMRGLIIIIFIDGSLSLVQIMAN